MTLDEFKAWFDGYTEAGGTDVSRVKEKLAEVFTLQPFPNTIPWINPGLIPLSPITIPSPYPWINPGLIPLSPITIPSPYPWVTVTTDDTYRPGLVMVS